MNYIQTVDIESTDIEIDESDGYKSEDDYFRIKRTDINYFSQENEKQNKMKIFFKKLFCCCSFN